MDQSIDLEAAKAAFFASGGTIVVLEGFHYQPIPARRCPDPSPLSHDSIAPAVDQRQARLDELRELSRTMTYEESQAATGLSKAALFRASRDGNFVFRRAKRKAAGVCAREVERQIQRNLKRIEELKLVERIRALRDQGLSRAQAAKEVGLSFGGLGLVIERNAINFPKKLARK